MCILAEIKIKSSIVFLMMEEEIITGTVLAHKLYQNIFRLAKACLTKTSSNLETRQKWHVTKKKTDAVCKLNYHADARLNRTKHFFPQRFKTWSSEFNQIKT